MGPGRRNGPAVDRAPAEVELCDPILSRRRFWPAREVCPADGSVGSAGKTCPRQRGRAPSRAHALLCGYLRRRVRERARKCAPRIGDEEYPGHVLCPERVAW